MVDVLLTCLYKALHYSVYMVSHSQVAMINGMYLYEVLINNPMLIKLF